LIVSAFMGCCLSQSPSSKGETTPQVVNFPRKDSGKLSVKSVEEVNDVFPLELLPLDLFFAILDYAEDSFRRSSQVSRTLQYRVQDYVLSRGTHVGDFAISTKTNRNNELEIAIKLDVRTCDSKLFERRTFIGRPIDLHEILRSRRHGVVIYEMKFEVIDFESMIGFMRRTFGKFLTQVSIECDKGIHLSDPRKICFQEIKNYLYYAYGCNDVSFAADNRKTRD
ncbi:hypothetical protein PMAYCL1PPCAC_33430, partial [Pristionchus mayeri]